MPIGLAVDRGFRRTALAAGLATWNLCTFATGLAANFVQMLFLRMGVGAGEATLNPTAVSLISEQFPPTQRGLAFSVYSSGAFIGGGVAFILGGLFVAWLQALGHVTLPFIGPTAPWRLAFIALGIGFMPLLLVVALLPKSSAATVASNVKSGSSREYAKREWRTLLPLFVAFPLLATVQSALIAWTPVALVRAYGVSASDAGLMVGIPLLFAGTAGNLVGGYITDRMRAVGVFDAPIRAAIIAAVALLPLGGMLSVSLERDQFALLLGLTMFFACLPFGVQMNALQAAVQSEFRGRVVGVYLLVSALVGYGAGPIATALFTDLIFQDSAQILHSLSLTALVFASIALLFLLLVLRGYGKLAAAVAAREADVSVGTA